MSKKPKKSDGNTYDEYIPVFFFSRQIVFHIVADKKTPGSKQYNTRKTIGNCMLVLSILICFRIKNCSMMHSSHHAAKKIRKRLSDKIDFNEL